MSSYIFLYMQVINNERQIICYTYLPRMQDKTRFVNSLLIGSIRLLIHCKISLLFSFKAQQGLNATHISGMKEKVSMESSDLKWYF